jgi:putative transposase
MARKKSGRTRRQTNAYTRRFTGDQKQHALTLLASGIRIGEVARIIGTTDKSLHNWRSAALEMGSMPKVPVATGGVRVRGRTGKATRGGEVLPAPNLVPVPGSVPAQSIYAPKDPGQGLSEQETAAILELKCEHPSYGPAQIRAQLKRFKGWRLANKAIARVLRSHGYELVHRGSRPQGPEPIRFEAPRRNALWQMDHTDLRVGDDKFALLVILDDFSRYVVAHAVSDSQDAASVVKTLRSAMARHGKPEAVRSDRGGAFTGSEVGKALEAELIDHVVGRSYHPEGGGKVEAVIGTLRRELWDVEHFTSRRQAEARLATFFADYNERRAHMGIDGLTPADRYFGRADRILAQVDAVSRRRNVASGMMVGSGGPIEEQALTEVLRLMIVDGEMELRFCGAVVNLGKIVLK